MGVNLNTKEGYGECKGLDIVAFSKNDVRF